PPLRGAAVGRGGGKWGHRALSGGVRRGGAGLRIAAGEGGRKEISRPAVCRLALHPPGAIIRLSSPLRCLMAEPPPAPVTPRGRAAPRRPAAPARGRGAGGVGPGRGPNSPRPAPCPVLGDAGPAHRGAAAALAGSAGAGRVPHRRGIVPRPTGTGRGVAARD